MSFPIKFQTTALSLLLVSGSLTADPLAEQMSFVPWTGGNFRSEWPGVAQRTYFYQWSLDLVSWEYAPFIGFGDGGHEYFVVIGPEKQFVRLFTVDGEGVTTLQQARDADFDNDGIPNSYEVETLGTDPYDRTSAGGDSDNDGLPDGWELFNFGNVTQVDGTDNPDLDQLTNAYESALGTNPNAELEILTTSALQLFIPNEP